MFTNVNKFLQRLCVSNFLKKMQKAIKKRQKSKASAFEMCNNCFSAFAYKSEQEIVNKNKRKPVQIQTFSVLERKYIKFCRQGTIQLQKQRAMI